MPALFPMFQTSSSVRNQNSTHEYRTSDKPWRREAKDNIKKINRQKSYIFTKKKKSLIWENYALIIWKMVRGWEIKLTITPEIALIFLKQFTLLMKITGVHFFFFKMVELYKSEQHFRREWNMKIIVIERFLINFYFEGIISILYSF